MDTVTAPVEAPIVQPRTAPWLKKGKIVTGAMTCAEAIVKGGLDYTVEKAPMFAQYMEANIPQMAPIKNKVAMMRTDNRAVLGFVGPEYHIIQNLEAFNFFDSILASNEAAIEVVGMQGLGEKIYILARMPQDTIVKNDIVHNYILLVTAHDGSSTIRVCLTPMRPVCFNALSLALSRSEVQIKIHHRMNADAKLNAAKDVLGLVKRQQKMTEIYFNSMSEQLITPPKLEGFLDSVFPVKDATARGASRTVNIRNEVVRLFNEGAGNKGQSLWDLYNGATEYCDHFRVIKNGGDRFESAILGSAFALKQRIFQSAISMLPVQDIESRLLVA